MAWIDDDSPNTVLLAIDHSSHAKDTVQYYVRRIHRPGNKVILTYVIELPENAMQAMNSMMSNDVITEMWKKEEDRAEQLEADYVEELKKSGILKISIRNDCGMKPGHVICHVAEEEKANLIVMGSRGAGKIRRTLLGSVSDYVVNHAQCPVLVCNYGKDRIRHSSNKSDKADKERHPSGRSRHGSGHSDASDSVGGRERHASGRERLIALAGTERQGSPCSLK